MANLEIVFSPPSRFNYNNNSSSYKNNSVILFCDEILVVGPVFRADVNPIGHYRTIDGYSDGSPVHNISLVSTQNASSQQGGSTPCPDVRLVATNNHHAFAGGWQTLFARAKPMIVAVGHPAQATNSILCHYSFSCCLCAAILLWLCCIDSISIFLLYSAVLHYISSSLLFLLSTVLHLLLPYFSPLLPLLLLLLFLLLLGWETAALAPLTLLFRCRLDEW